MKLGLGQNVYHKDIYWGREQMKVVGIREKEVELEGDYSGGTHNVCQKSWQPLEGTLLLRSDKPIKDTLKTFNKADLKENKTIAEFMGCEVVFDEEYKEYGINGEPLTCYNYNTSWELLMPVVEKIEALDLSDWWDEENFMNVGVNIESGHCYIHVELNYDPPHRVTGLSNYGIPKIELVHSQVVKFIDWYNKNNQISNDKNR